MNNSIKIEFKQMPLNMEVEVIASFLDSNWKNKITNKIPELKNIAYKDINIIKKIISGIRDRDKSKLSNGLINIKGDWNKISEEATDKLYEIIQIKQSELKIKAYISINPICPRFLDNLSFSLSPNTKNPNLTICHEICHFIYFKKFSEVFPNIKKENYEFPHREWILSEIVAVLILNNKKMRAIHNGKSDYYEDHKKISIGDKKLVNIIEELYKDYSNGKNNFEVFLKKSLEVVNRN